MSGESILPPSISHATNTTLSVDANANDDAAAIAALTAAAKYTVFNEGPTIIRRDLEVLEIICNFAVEMLNSIRTKCSTSVEITLEQLRMQESKLIRMISEHLVARAKLREYTPSVELPPAVNVALRQWLNVTGLSEESVEAVVSRCDNSLERLLELDDDALRSLLAESSTSNAEEERRIVDSAAMLRRCRQMLIGGDASRKTANFYWESWDRYDVSAGSGSVSSTKYGGEEVRLYDSSVPPTPSATFEEPSNLHIPPPASALTPSRLHSITDTAHSGMDAAAALRSNSCPTVEPLPNSGAQFSPPSADTAAQTLAAVLNSQRRQTISPASHSSISNMVGRRSRTPSPSPGHTDGTPPPAAATPSSFFARLAAAAVSATSSSSSSSQTQSHPKFPTTPPPRRKMQTTLPVTLPPQVLQANPLSENHAVCQQQQLLLHQQQQQQLLPKSESNESQLSLASDNSACSVDSMSDENPMIAAILISEHFKQTGQTTRHRLHTDSSPERYDAHYTKSYTAQPQDYSAQFTPTHGVGSELYPQSLHVPRSPGTPLGFQRGSAQAGSSGGGYSPLQTSTSSESSASTHGHRFNKKFKVMSTCDVCGKQMFFGLKCKECKFRCHKDCEPSIISTCKSFCQAQQQMSDSWNNRSPNLGQRSGGHISGSGLAGGTLRNAGGRRDRLRSTDYQGGPIGGGGMLGTESGTSAGSSCNSSTPSSPALFQAVQNAPNSAFVPPTISATINNIAATNPGSGLQRPPGNAAQNASSGAIVKTQFRFPEVSQIYKPNTVGSITLEAHLKREELQQKQMRANQKQQLKQQQQQQTASRPSNSPRNHKPAKNVKSLPDGGTTTTGPVVGGVSVAQQKQNNQPATNAVADSFSLLDSGAVGGMQIPTITNTIASDDPTTTVNSEASSNTDSDRTAIRMDSVDDPDSTDDRADADGHWSRQNSVSMREWDIPFEDIIINDKIGDGRFGTVHGALWHGHVVVKILKEDYLDNEAFKVEIATFKKTRHENVVLFMGACMNPQAIVTARCKGNTLYTHMHVLKAKFSLNRTLVVANQVSLGMGYLHARHITHKDLKSKNIFIESGRVIITDFGLFSATKLEYDERLGLRVPYGWLPYLAPEIIQKLPSRQPEHRDLLPFSIKSDIYAFGTVWYELLCQEFPYKSQSPEAIIFQVGRGMKQSLANLQAARDMKDLLMMCWAYDCNVRPDFSGVLVQLEKIPRKRLARSPSHPVQLSRSAESVF